MILSRRTFSLGRDTLVRLIFSFILLLSTAKPARADLDFFNIVVNPNAFYTSGNFYLFDSGGSGLVHAVLVTAPTHGTLNWAGSLGGFTYTPTPGFTGTDFLEWYYLNVSNNNRSSTRRGNFFVNPPGISATSLNFTASANGTLNQTDKLVELYAGDSQGDPLTGRVSQNPTHGTVVFNGDGSFVYTPTPGYTGGDVFFWVAADATSQSAPARISINVTLPGISATSLNFTASANGSLNQTDKLVELYAGDSQGNPLTGRVSQNPTHGTVVFNGDGTFVYTPAPGYTGGDVFFWVAADATSQSEPARISINVTLPGISATSLNFTASANGTLNQTDKLVELYAGDSQGDPLTGRVSQNPTHGTVVFNGDGSFVYTPTPGYTGEDVFFWVAADATSQSEPARISINVTRPSLGKTEFGYVVGNNAVLQESAALLTEFASDGQGDPLTARVVENPQHGSVRLNSNGSFTYTPDRSFAGGDTFKWVAADATSESDPAIVRINILNVGITSFRLDGPTANARISAAGLPNTDYEISSSVDLVVWTVLGTVKTDSAGAFSWSDPEGAIRPHCFYRFK